MFSCILLLVFAMPLAVIDIRTRRLPNRLTLAALLAVAASVGVQDAFGANWMRGLLAMVASVLAYFVSHVVSRGGVGMGDVKFSAAIGMWAGSISWTCAVQAIEWAWLAAGMWSLALLAARRTSLRTSIPFGPFMAVGVVGAAALNLPQ